ncbi:hypothetical protein V1502_10420 [Bacillus sp. SCS-153A]|uniref:hypothetical protein n=1 Tax=Rossellomorea sedimentorum TaxID=3115294 RepID=UPI003905D79D
MNNKIKEEMEKINIPEEVHTRALKGINKAKQEMETSFVSKVENLFGRFKIPAFVTGILFSLGIGAFAANNELVSFLESDSGKESIEFSSEGEGDSDFDHQAYVQTYDSLVERHFLNKLNPGEVAAFYSVRAVEESDVNTPPQPYYYDEPLLYSGLNDFKEAIHHTYTPHPELPGGFKFKEGIISYWFDFLTGDEKRELQKSARGTDEEIVKKVYKVSDEQRTVKSKYTNGTSEIVVSSSILKFQIDEYKLPEESILESIKINNEDALYLLEQTEEYRIKQVKWIDDENGVSIMYSVATEDIETVTKEDLINISEEIRGLQAVNYQSSD